MSVYILKELLGYEIFLGNGVSMSEISNAELLETTDCTVWAKAFVEALKRNSWTIEDIDEDLMMAWFANAFVAQEFEDNMYDK